MKLCTLIALLVLAGCSPKIYAVDIEARQVLVQELEAQKKVNTYYGNVLAQLVEAHPELKKEGK